MKLTNETCSMIKKPCPFCSEESTLRPYTQITRDGHTGLFKPVKQGWKRASLGQICNNAPIGGKFWIDEMHYCPVVWDKARKGIKYVR